MASIIKSCLYKCFPGRTKSPLAPNPASSATASPPTAPRHQSVLSEPNRSSSISYPPLPDTAEAQELRTASIDSRSQTALQTTQERLWNEAYDELKNSETKTVEAYEKILSAEIRSGDLAPTNTASIGNEIIQTRDGRQIQMKELVKSSLERTQKVASIKERINDGMQVVYTVKDIVDKAVKAAPEAAIVWASVCFGLEVGPLLQSKECTKPAR